MNKSGFIGAIGDDLPSLIPIVVALLLFFSIFSVTMSNYNSRNLYFRKQMEMISVSRELKGDSLLLGVDQFNEKCDSIRLRQVQYNFKSGVFITEVEPKDIIIPDNEGSPEAKKLNGEKVEVDRICLENNSEEYCKYLCEYVRIGSRDFTGKEKNYSIQYHPVAVQTEITAGQSVVAPAIMAVVVWE